jgi:Na+-transporting NADH:ubiquinone oxidoreductase subunit C
MSENELNAEQQSSRRTGPIGRLLDMPNDSMFKTFAVAILLCLICSFFVSMSATVLKPLQVANKELDKRKNILAVAGISFTDETINQAFDQIQSRVVDLASGEYTEAVDAETFDQLSASKDPQYSVDVARDLDIATIGSRSRYAVVYQVNDASGNLEKLVLPVRGYGLWGTLYGFMALHADVQTAAGLKFYEHKETPGLGAQVDNPDWQAQWDGKQAIDNVGVVTVSLIKGRVNPNDPEAATKIDGLSGATLTSNGVNNLVHYWLGDHAFGPFLNNLRNSRG